MQGPSGSYFHPESRPDVQGIRGTEFTGPSRTRGELDDAARDSLPAGASGAFPQSLVDAAEFT